MDKDEVLKWLERKGTRKYVEGMSRYGIQTDKRVFGVSVGTLRSFAKQLGKDHALAAELWKSGCYEGQMLATLIDDRKLVTRSQMNAWAADFDNWAICDTACFHLFDRTPFAWQKAHQWSTSRHEFVKRAAFAMMAGLTIHDKAAPDKQFLELLPLIETGAHDDRNFVKKAVNWALRSIGKRSQALNTAAIASAKGLAQSEEAVCRWVGKDALRELSSQKVKSRLARRPTE
ncbi:MAG TPA: DNA alkylation repair protein [Pyrinomonadaceae bacterium]|nr:DNA alkylation repair protein [Pyrinomonadaceae bacterium]